MTMRLFHFSDDPDITIFHPRPVRVAVDRPAGQERLNGPLVWATDEAHELLYLFPRECPRIVVWPTQYTSEKDRTAWFGETTNRRAIAHIERAWLDRLASGVIYRYHLAVDQFEDIDDAGMWVSNTPVVPSHMDVLDNLIAELDSRKVELRIMGSLTPLKEIWQTTLHASGIRLRNAQGWGKPGWTHSKPGRAVAIK
jgi:hypothetical protein